MAFRTCTAHIDLGAKSRFFPGTPSLLHRHPVARVAPFRPVSNNAGEGVTQQFCEDQLLFIKRKKLYKEGKGPAMPEGISCKTCKGSGAPLPLFSARQLSFTCHITCNSR